MKKRLISFLLALCMVLSLVPVGAVADGTSTFASGKTITASDLGLGSDNKPTNVGGEDYGWTYTGSSYNKTLTIKECYILDLGDATLDCTYVSVVNDGEIKSGTFILPVFNTSDSAVSFTNNGTISGGKFFKNSNGKGLLYNTASSTITGGFFGSNIYVWSKNNERYTITGGIFLDAPSSYTGVYTYVAVTSNGSSSAYSRKDYTLNSAGGYSEPVGTSTIDNGFYMFGAQTVTLTLPYDKSAYNIVDEWRYLKNGVATDASKDSTCPVTVTPSRIDGNAPNKNNSFRRVTIRSSVQTETKTVLLYPYAYETSLKLDSEGFPDTSNAYQGSDGHFYGINYYMVDTYPNTYASAAEWEYDPSTKTLMPKSVIDISKLNSNVNVLVTSGARISSNTEIGSPVTIQGYYGSIASGSTATFTGNVTLSGTDAKISGGIFKGTVTLADGATIEQITGGLFEKDINNSLYRVTLKDGSTFKVNGYTNNFPYVYVSPSTTLSVTSTNTDAKAFGRINSTKLDANPSYCTVSGKTITFKAQDLINAGVVTDADNKTIVLAPALEDIDADMFTVTTKDFTYGDDFQTPTVAKSTTAHKAVGEPSIAGYYKLDDNGKVPTNPTLLNASEVTDAGTYQVVLNVAETDTYAGADKLTSDSESWRFTISPKTLDSKSIKYSGLTTTYDGTPKAVTVTVTDMPRIMFTVLYNGNSEAPTDAGNYTVTVQLAANSNPNYTLDPNLGAQTLTIKKAKLTAENFEKDNEYRTVKPKDGIHLTDDEYTVTFTPAPSTQGLPTDADGTHSAGDYLAEVTVHEDAKNYCADGTLTDPGWVFTVAQEVPTTDLLDVTVPENPVYTGSAITATVRAKTAEELNSDTAPAGPLTGELIVEYYRLNKDGTREEPIDAPVEPGTYEIRVTTSGEGNYSQEPLSDKDWVFTIAEPENAVHVEGGYAYYMDGEVKREIGGSKVLAGTTVYLVMDGAETPDTPALTLLAADEDSEVGTVLWFVDPRTRVELTIENPDEATGAHFTMPRGEVWVTTTRPGSDTPAAVSSGDAGTGVALVVGGAALGGAAYLVGTRLWLEANLPADAAIPTSRQQLADLLWTAAGRPEPAGTALFTDISAEAVDSQKAARWCVEQGLLRAEGDTFQPAKHTFRPQVIKAWKQLQAGRKAG